MANDEQSTPQELFDKLNIHFKFGLDAAASAKNTKCKKYFCKKDNALGQPWNCESFVWLNPPYSKEAGGIEAWLKKAYVEVTYDRCKGVVSLVPADCSTRYYMSSFITAVEICALTPRIKFNDASAGAKFASMLVIFEKSNKKVCSLWNWAKSDFQSRLYR